MVTNVLESQAEWKNWEVTRLGLPPDVEQDLQEDGVLTIGELLKDSEWSQEDHVRAAMSRFFENYPEYALESEAEDEEEAEEQALEQEDPRYRHYKEIQAANERWLETTEQWLVSKQEAAELKKIADAAGSHLQKIISRGPDPQRKLFHDYEGAEVDAEFSVIADDAWRNADVGLALGLTEKQIEKLHDAGVTTMGEFVDLDGKAGISSIDGIGEATSDKLKDRMVDWLNENRDHIGAAC